MSDSLFAEAVKFSQQLAGSPSALSETSPFLLTLLEGLGGIPASQPERFKRFLGEASHACLLAALQYGHDQSLKILETLCLTKAILNLVDLVENCFSAAGTKSVNSVMLGNLLALCSAFQDDCVQSVPPKPVASLAHLSKIIVASISRNITLDEHGPASARSASCITILIHSCKIRPKLFLEPLRRMLLMMSWKEKDGEEVKLSRNMARYISHLETSAASFGKIKTKAREELFENIPTDAWGNTLRSLVFTEKISRIFSDAAEAPEYLWSPLWTYILSTDASQVSFSRTVFSPIMWLRLSTDVENCDLEFISDAEFPSKPQQKDRWNFVGKMSEVWMAGDFLRGCVGREMVSENIFSAIDAATELLFSLGSQILMATCGESAPQKLRENLKTIWNVCIQFIIDALASPGAPSLPLSSKDHASSDIFVGDSSSALSWTYLEHALLNLSKILKTFSKNRNIFAAELAGDLAERCLRACRDAVGVIFVAAVTVVGIPDKLEFSKLVAECASARTLYGPSFLPLLSPSLRRQTFLELLHHWATTENPGEVPRISIRNFLFSEDSVSEFRAVAMALSHELKTGNLLTDSVSPCSISLAVVSSAEKNFLEIFANTGDFLGAREKYRILEFWCHEWRKEFLDGGQIFLVSKKTVDSLKRVCNFIQKNKLNLSPGVYSAAATLRTALITAAGEFSVGESREDFISEDEIAAPVRQTSARKKRRGNFTRDISSGLHSVDRTEENMNFEILSATKITLAKSVIKILDENPSKIMKQQISKLIFERGPSTICWLSPPAHSSFSSVENISSVAAISTLLFLSSSEDAIWPFLNFLDKFLAGTSISSAEKIQILKNIEKIDGVRESSVLLFILTETQTNFKKKPGAKILDVVSSWTSQKLFEILTVSPGLCWHLLRKFESSKSNSIPYSEIIFEFSKLTSCRPESVAKIFSEYLCVSEIECVSLCIFADVMAVADRASSATLLHFLAEKLSDDFPPKNEVSSTEMPRVPFQLFKNIFFGSPIQLDSKILEEVWRNEQIFEAILRFLLTFPRAAASLVGGNSVEISMRAAAEVFNFKKNIIKIIEIAMAPRVGVSLENLQGIYLAAPDSDLPALLEKYGAKKSISCFVSSESCPSEAGQARVNILETAEVAAILRRGWWIPAVINGLELDASLDFSNIFYSPLLLDIVAFGSPSARNRGFEFGKNAMTRSGEFAVKALTDAAGRLDIFRHSDAVGKFLSLALASTSFPSTQIVENLWCAVCAGKHENVNFDVCILTGLYPCVRRLGIEKSESVRQKMFQILCRCLKTSPPEFLEEECVSAVYMIIVDAPAPEAAKYFSDLAQLSVGDLSDQNWHRLSWVVYPLLTLPSSRHIIASSLRSVIAASTMPVGNKVGRGSARTIAFYRSLNFLITHGLYTTPSSTGLVLE